MPNAAFLQATTTVADILADVQNDGTTAFFTDAASSKITWLIGLVNRIHQQMNRYARWQWQLSPVQRYITKVGQTDYWLGAVGMNPPGSADTGLNLLDINQIKEGTVFDRTNYKELKKTLEVMPLRGLAFPDASSYPSIPKQWREDPDSPNVMNIYPAAQLYTNTSYQPVPESPYCQVTAGGTLPARTYFARTTFVDQQGGESTSARDPGRIFVPLNNYVIVNSPITTIPGSADGTLYSHWNCYISEEDGTETLQNVSPIAIGTNYTESGGGITNTGASVPTLNSLEQLWGFIIEFRYWKQRVILTATTDVLTVPDIYKDIVTAGVNNLVFQYLSKTDQEYIPLKQEWAGAYQGGLREIIKDFNLFPKDSDYITPDVSARQRLTWGQGGFIY